MLPEWMHIPDDTVDRALLRRHLSYPDQPVRTTHQPVRIVPPYDFTHSFHVKPAEAGQSILELLFSRFPFRSRPKWEQKLANEQVLLNGEPASPTTLLRHNDRISHRNIAVVEPAVPDDIRIIFENEALLLIDKPAPMPVHPGGRYNKNTVISVLADMGYPSLHVVHRLDAVTSGLLLFSKHREYVNPLMQMFLQGNVKKVYEAIISGEPLEDEALIRTGIRRRKGIAFMCTDENDGKSAETRIHVLERGRGWARVTCEPVTGRTHQIRLHLQHWGFPIWDDPLYGPDVDLDQVFGETELAPHPVMQNRPISLVNMHIGFNRPENLP